VRFTPQTQRAEWRLRCALDANGARERVSRHDRTPSLHGLRLDLLGKDCSSSAAAVGRDAKVHCLLELRCEGCRVARLRFVYAPRLPCRCSSSARVFRRVGVVGLFPSASPHEHFADNAESSGLCFLVTIDALANFADDPSFCKASSLPVDRFRRDRSWSGFRPAAHSPALAQRMPHRRSRADRRPEARLLARKLESPSARGRSAGACRRTKSGASYLSRNSS